MTVTKEDLKMKKIIVVLLILSMSIFLVSCGWNDMPSFPFFEYVASNWKVDYNNRYIDIRDGYILDPSHPYDEIDTNNGCDCVFHLVKSN